MTKQEQIEEMQLTMLNTFYQRYTDTKMVKANNDDEFLKQAAALYNAGYRKLPEDRVVLSREEIINMRNKHDDSNEIIASKIADLIAQARSEVAIEIFKEIRERFVASYLLPTGLDLPAKRVKYAKITDDELDELAKKYCVEVEE